MALLTRMSLPALGICLVSLLAACANDGQALFGNLGATTTAASAPQKPKMTPLCQALSSQIGSLRQEGIAEKVEKAAAKKYKMTASDLNKAVELNKANAEFQSRCLVAT
jgi:hypothetical protein